MPETANALTLEFLTWLSSRPRTYAETMEAWRSTCPRHPIWEDALMNGLVEIVDTAGAFDLSQVTLTAKGRTILENR